jgi:Transglycosylase SLT domain
MQTPRVHSWLTRASVAAVLIALIGARDVRAAKRKPPAAAPPPPPVLRFPDTPSDTLISELTQAGRVTATLPPEPEDWRRWGRAVPEDQDLSVRAIADALAKARLPIDLSAMILAIARVESGFNPFSEHPISTACGLFQFVEGTWEHYQPTRDTCFDPYVNAWAGVRHLSMLDSGRLRDARRLLQGVPDEVQRTEYLYRLLYAYHYHGPRSLYAALGGSLTAQQAADGGVPYLKRYYSILNKATYVPPPPAKKPVVRKARVGARGAHRRRR